MTKAEKEKRAKPIGKRTPTPDPKRVKVTLEQMGRLHAHFQQMMQTLQESTRSSFTQQFENIKALAAGLDSSEFNLRAHQKVLNSVVLDQLHLFQVINTMATDLNQLLVAAQGEDAELYETVEPQHIALTEIADEDGEVVDYRVDWPFYHQQVTDDKEEAERLQKEAEEKAKAELDAAKEASDEKQIQEQVEEVKKKAIEAGNDPEEVAAAAETLLRETKAVADETGKMMRGESYDEEVIAEAQKKIEEDEKENPSSDFPAGATIFGGG
jgi:hypothetical protein